MDSWDDIRLFLAVARSGTLTGAAAVLGIGISTLHRKLAVFEDSLGAPLFEKGPRGYQLTLAAEALLPHAEEVEEGVFAAQRTLLGHDLKATGEVRVTMPLIFLPVIAPHVSTYAKECPGVRLILQADDVSLRLDRETDLALRATTRPPDTAVGRDLCGLAWGHYTPVGCEGDAMPWIHYQGMEHSAAVQWRRTTFPSSSPILVVQSVVAMHAMLPDSCAQGLLPCFVGDTDPRLRRIGEPVAMNRLWLLIHADLRRSARVRSVIDFFVPRLLDARDRFEGRLSAQVASATR